MTAELRKEDRDGLYGRTQTASLIKRYSWLASRYKSLWRWEAVSSLAIVRRWYRFRCG